MNTVTVTLTLSPLDASIVLRFVDELQRKFQVSTTPKLISQDESPVQQLKEAVVPLKVPPTAGKKISMPGLGRTQTQIQAYISTEAARVETLDEEAAIKAQRAEEKAARKAIKDAEEDIKRATIKVAVQQVESIIAAAKPAIIQEAGVAPWKL